VPKKWNREKRRFESYTERDFEEWEEEDDEVEAEGKVK